MEIPKNKTPRSDGSCPPRKPRGATGAQLPEILQKNAFSEKSPKEAVGRSWKFRFCARGVFSARGAPLGLTAVGSYQIRLEESTFGPTKPDFGKSRLPIQWRLLREVRRQIHSDAPGISPAHTPRTVRNREEFQCRTPTRARAKTRSGAAGTPLGGACAYGGLRPHP